MGILACHSISLLKWCFRSIKIIEHYYNILIYGALWEYVISTSDRQVLKVWRWCAVSVVWNRSFGMEMCYFWMKLNQFYFFLAYYKGGRAIWIDWMKRNSRMVDVFGSISIGCETVTWWVKKCSCKVTDTVLNWRIGHFTMLTWISIDLLCWKDL